MDQPDSKQGQERKYPVMYEKIMPIALAFIGVSIIVLMAIIVVVVLKLVPFAA